MSDERTFRLDRLVLNIEVLGFSHEGIAGRWKIGYELWDKQFDPDNPVFKGSDYSPGCGTPPLSDEVCLGLLAFLTLREGDTDDEYFENYTEKQLKWRNEEDLEYWSCLVHDLEEEIDAKQLERQPTRWERENANRS